MKKFLEFNWKDEDLLIDDFISIDPDDLSDYKPDIIEVKLPNKPELKKEVTGTRFTMKTGKEYFVPTSYKEFKKLLEDFYEVKTS